MRRAIGLVVLVAACGTGPPAAGPAPAAARDQVETTLFLIGDAGAPAPNGEPVLRALDAALDQAAGERLVLFLGDNIYPRGLPDSAAPGRVEAERRLDAQVEVVADAGVRGIFIPGNHDWAKSGHDGWDAIRRQERYLNGRGHAGVVLLPRGGCPGPEVVDVGRRTRLVLLDTQWWLHDGPKPVGDGTSCRAATADAVVDSLRVDLARARDRRAIVAAHHPLATGGEHGGAFGFRDHLFPLRHVASWLWVPLPGIGSLYPLSRQAGISSQDIPGPANRRMRAALEAAMADHPPLAFASGHDHNLQVLAGRSARYLLVSGAGIYGHQGRVARLPETRFHAAAPGFMRLEILKDGRVRLGAIVVDAAGKGSERFSMWLE